jgi:gamma-glutamyltranspeptidase / glutathione hydrolase
MAVLERGGNAFDAAVAAGLTLQVVEPDMNGPGGDLPAILWPAGNSEPVVLCAQGPAPQQATSRYYRDHLGLDIIPGTGPLAAVVPGAFGGWMAMLRDFGTMSLRDVTAFAISYAAAGYPILSRTRSIIDGLEPFFRDEWTTSGSVYLPAPGPGGLARNLALAATYERVVQEAEARSPVRDGQIEAALDIWYRGWVAEAIIKFQNRPWMDTSGDRHTGLLSADDLARWAPTYEVPVSVGYAGYTVFKTGPWGQGPVFLQQLQLLEGFDLKAMGHGHPDYVHVITECAKLAFADREAWYGDPQFVDVPMAALLSKGYADRRRELVSEESSPELRPGAPYGRPPRLPDLEPHGGAKLDERTGNPEASSVSSGTAAPASNRAASYRTTPYRGDTVHLDIVDREGNMVSATPSGGWLHGAPVVPELGFCLGTRGQMFWLEDGVANSLEPGKRPRTTLSPTMIARDGEPYLALGTPGGDQQDQWALHAFLAHAHFGMDLQMAIDSPNHHTEAFPSSFYPRRTRPQYLAVEQRAQPGTIEALRSHGHHVDVMGPWSLGRVSAVSRSANGLLRGAADPRGGQAYVCGR